MATPHISAEKGDFAKTVLMPGDPLRAKFIADTFLQDVRQVTGVRGMLGFTGTYATSFYFGNPSVAGTTVIDTNVASVMAANGFTAGAHTNILGTPVDNGNLSPNGQFFNPPKPAGVNIDALNAQG